MTYNFINQSDESLKALSTAVWEEQRRRFHTTIAFRPPPQLVYDDDKFHMAQSIMKYREQHAVSLSEAKWVVEYFKKKWDKIVIVE